MRFIEVNCSNTGATIVNASHIVSIYSEAGSVLMTLTDGRTLATEFTTVSHATDYVQRASSYSFNETVQGEL